LRKHRITFYSPGTLFSEASDRSIDSWDTKKAVAMAKDIMERHNAKPYGFKFETLLVSDDVPDGEGGWLKTQSKTVETSGTHFLTGTLETYDDVVRRNSDKESILRTNMHANGYWIVCINTNSYRSTLPFDEKDRIVDMDGNVVERGDDPKYVAYRAEQEVKRTACKICHDNFHKEHGKRV
jgi:hypothetical protein